MSAAAIRLIVADLQLVAHYDKPLSPSVLQSAMRGAGDKLAAVRDAPPSVRKFSDLLHQVANSSSDIIACRRSVQTIGAGLLGVADLLEQTGSATVARGAPKPVTRMPWLRRLLSGVGVAA